MGLALNWWTDVLNVDGSVDVAVTDRIWSGWNKFRQLSAFLTVKGTPLNVTSLD